MVNSFLSLWHYIIIGRYNNNNYVRYFGSTGTHGSESFVPRCVKEGNLATVFQCHVVGTDVLCDAACLTCNNVGLSDVVQQRSLTMIHMSHYRNNRRTWLEIFFSICFFHDSLSHFCTDIFRLETKLLSH